MIEKTFYYSDLIQMIYFALTRNRLIESEKKRKKKEKKSKKV